MLRQKHCSGSKKSVKSESAVTLLEADLAHMGGVGYSQIPALLSASGPNGPEGVLLVQLSCPHDT